MIGKGRAMVVVVVGGGFFALVMCVGGIAASRISLGLWEARGDVDCLRQDKKGMPV